MSDTMNQDDPAAIERDIRRTQEDMSRTVDQIGDQLTPKKLFNSLLDKADEKGVDTDYLIDGARRNPMALGLIAAGAIWLVSDKDSKFPSLPKGKSAGGGRDFADDGSDHDVHHRDYVTHMSSFETRENEEPLAYQRRRDQHRANFLMCERKHDEDDSSFRQRLDEMTDKFREKRRAWSDSASQAGSGAGRKAQETAQQASERAQDLFAGNPLVTGILAAAIGAAIGSTIPVSRTEKEKLGALGGKALDKANEGKEALTAQAMEKKDELLEKADQKLQQSSEGQPQPDSGNPAGEAPFILGDAAR
ncbi:MAG TPA: DUF3618 domain-containing protein [Allosphingosinicella sp.]|nr:DUF3618 domain-containing protein [Allosphingosinicella sp.]